MRTALIRQRSRLGLLAFGLCLLVQGTGAEVKISQVGVEGQPQDAQASSEFPAPTAKPLRLSSTAQTLQFRFTESNPQGRPTARLRYKLEGYDDSWRDLPVQMRVLVHFRDRDNRGVGSAEFYFEGESPGWRGTLVDSDFLQRREQVTVPDRATSAHLSFLTHGGETGMGVIALDAIRVRVEAAGTHPPEVFDLSVTQGDDLSDPMGKPDNWTRETGSRPELARLQIRPIPTPHPILVLEDDDPNNYGNWSTMPLKGIPVRAGERLTLEWEVAHSLGRSGPGQANYPQLKPGRYWFRVATAKANGQVTGQEVSLPIVVVAPIYHRVEFWLVLVALAGGGTVGARQLLVQRRIQRRLAEVEHQQTLERERARIARDLHDDIGAGLTEIAMQSDWVRRDLVHGPTADTLRRIERVCQSAVELTRSVDEMVWAVTPANDTVARFANYLAQSTEQFLDAAGLRVRFDIPRELPVTALPGKVRHSLFLAVREALNNVTKHARADLVRLEISVEDTGLRLAIEDNGCGLALEQLGAAGTHEGLNTMRRRMEEIGGQFHLTSRPGSGTRVEFFTPLPG